MVGHFVSHLSYSKKALFPVENMSSLCKVPSIWCIRQWVVFALAISVYGPDEASYSMIVTPLGVTKLPISKSNLYRVRKLSHSRRHSCSCFISQHRYAATKLTFTQCATSVFQVLVAFIILAITLLSKFLCLKCKSCKCRRRRNKRRRNKRRNCKCCVLCAR